MKLYKIIEAFSLIAAVGIVTITVVLILTGNDTTEVLQFISCIMIFLLIVTDHLKERLVQSLSEDCKSGVEVVHCCRCKMVVNDESVSMETDSYTERKYFHIDITNRKNEQFSVDCCSLCMEFVVPTLVQDIQESGTLQIYTKKGIVLND